MNNRQILKGFTLVEMLVVIAIIGLLTTLLLPVVNTSREDARRRACTLAIRNAGVDLFTETQEELAAKHFGGHSTPTALGSQTKDDQTLDCPFCDPPWVPEPDPPTDGGDHDDPDIQGSQINVNGLCPDAKENPAYELDPITQPPTISYGYWFAGANASYDIRRPILLDADILAVGSRSEIAYDRHGFRANVYFVDGSVKEFKEDQPLLLE